MIREHSYSNIALIIFSLMKHWKAFQSPRSDFHLKLKDHLWELVVLIVRSHLACFVHNAHLKRTELAASWAALHLVYFKGVELIWSLAKLSQTLKRTKCENSLKVPAPDLDHVFLTSQSNPVTKLVKMALGFAALTFAHIFGGLELSHASPLPVYRLVGDLLHGPES